MKYLLILLVSTSVLISSVKGKIPHYIHICQRNNPEMSRCILNSILKLKGNLVSGIPELEVPPIDPLYLDSLDINLGPGFKAEARNLKISGGKDFKINDLVADVDANTYVFNVSLPEIHAVGTYFVDAKIAAIPLKGNGPITFTARHVNGLGTLRGKHVVRKGNTYNWFPTMSFKIDVTDYEVKLDNLFEGDPTIGEVTNKLLNEEKEEVLASISPALEKALIKYILIIANNITKKFTWDELFPLPAKS